MAGILLHKFVDLKLIWRTLTEMIEIVVEPGLSSIDDPDREGGIISLYVAVYSVLLVDIRIS
jgi:hypothetical protein